jgi:hypothetical protein
VPYPIVDVSNWPAAGEEQLGTKPKQWLAHPETQELWLWKESTWNRRRGDTPYRKGDDWSERVVCEVARHLGLPTAEVELATRGHSVGVVSRRFLGRDEGLVHGNELLQLQPDARRRTGYTPAAVEMALAGCGPPEPHPSLYAPMDWFAGYLVLDALVGNTDRHIENWGVVVAAAEVRPLLAPSFDHASSLGFLLSDEERQERLDTRDGNRTVSAYALRAQTKFQGRPRPATVASDALRRRPLATREHWRAAVASLISIDEIVAAVPDSRMSPIAREFASRLFEQNHTMLSQAVRILEP